MAMGQGIARLRMPSAHTLLEQLGAVKQAGIALWVLTGGGSPAFEDTADVVAEAGDGERGVIRTPHHFPNLQGTAFNDQHDAFMRRCEALRKPDGPGM